MSIPICLIAATLRISGALEKSTDVMKSMHALIKIPDIQRTMMDMSKEMMKVCTQQLTLYILSTCKNAHFGFSTDIFLPSFRIITKLGICVLLSFNKTMWLHLAGKLYDDFSCAL